MTGYTATGTGTDGRTYTARAGSRSAALHALADVFRNTAPRDALMIAHTVRTERGNR